VVKIFAFLELERNRTFFKGLPLLVVVKRNVKVPAAIGKKAQFRQCLVQIHPDIPSIILFFFYTKIFASKGSDC